HPPYARARRRVDRTVPERDRTGSFAHPPRVARAKRSARGETDQGSIAPLPESHSRREAHFVNVDAVRIASFRLRISVAPATVRGEHGLTNAAPSAFPAHRRAFGHESHRLDRWRRIRWERTSHPTSRLRRTLVFPILMLLAPWSRRRRLCGTPIRAG